MEDYNADGHTEEDKTPAEPNRKRKLKTPAQLQALEEHYEDHKYPTESMKSEIAEKIGLTEKQVSGWFCHRRLKDKRLSKDEADGSGRMDRSSGVIQEHFSGPGQDSCGSTIPGDYNKHAELKEVESQWLAGQEFSPTNFACHNKMNTARPDVDMDDTSSEGSSHLRPSHLPQRDVPQICGNSKYLIQNGSVRPSNPKAGIGTQSRRPSGYLKIKQKAEHPAITAVKKQLGKNFREDGPPLGIQFHPPPTDAFQAAPKNTTTGRSNGTDSLLRSMSGCIYHGAHSVGDVNIFYLPGAFNLTKGPKMHNGIFRPDDSYLEEQGPTVKHENEAFYSHRQSKPKSSVRINTKLDHGWDPSSNLDRDSAEGTYSGKDFSKGAKYVSNVLCIQPKETLTTDQTDDSLHNTGYVNPKTAPSSKHLKNHLSITKPRQRKPHDTSERGLYTREPEIEKLCSVSSNIFKCPNLGTMTGPPDYELMDERLPAARNSPKYPHPPGAKVVVDNELKDENAQLGYPQPDFAKKAKLARNGGRGAAGEFRSSVSEDETGETSSSGDE